MAPYEQPIIATEMGFLDELQAGMVIAFEPGFFAPGLGPIRTEDVVLVTEGRPSCSRRRRRTRGC